MKAQRLAIVLTIVNLAVLVTLLSQARPAVAQGVAPVLRGRALEIVDERGQVRAEVIVVPAAAIPGGRTEGETVLLRMRDGDGRIRVKIDANHDGSGLLLADDSQQPGLHMGTRDGAFMSVRNKDGREQVIKP
jgi:hypothetical protein